MREEDVRRGENDIVAGDITRAKVAQHWQGPI